jgi:hypothetical protein
MLCSSSFYWKAHFVCPCPSGTENALTLLSVDSPTDLEEPHFGVFAWKPFHLGPAFPLTEQCILRQTMGDSSLIPALWSPEEVSVAEDGFLWVCQELMHGIDDDAQPLLLASTSAVLRALYPSLDIKQILTEEKCYQVEEETSHDGQQSQPEDGPGTDNTSSSASPNATNNGDGALDGNLPPGTIEGDAQTGSDDQETADSVQPKISNPAYRIYQNLVRCDNLGNSINSALLDIQYSRHRGGGARRSSHRSRKETKVKALEHEQKRLLQKRSRSDIGENPRSATEGPEGSSRNQDHGHRAAGNSQSDGGRNDDAANDGHDENGDDDNDGANEEPRLVLLVRTLNSIRALYPHLLPILNHGRRNDRKLVIGETEYKTKKSGPMSWLLGTSVFDTTTRKLCTASHDDARRILEGYVDRGLAQRISNDHTGSPNFWPISWIQEVVKRSNPSVQNPLTIISTLSGRSDDEILERARHCDRIVDAVEQQLGTATTQHQYMKSVNKLHHRLSNILKARFRGAQVNIYGSCLSNLSLGKGSDVDVSLSIPDVQELKADFQHGRVSARAYEQAMKNYVYQTHRKLGIFKSEFRGLIAVAWARIPVISGTYNFADNPHTEDGSIE